MRDERLGVISNLSSLISNLNGRPEASMLKFIVVRILSAIPVLIGISLVSFIIIQLPPGDFASSFKTNLLNNGVSEHEAERQAEAVRVQYGLDQPVMIQYVRWMGNI